MQTKSQTARSVDTVLAEVNALPIKLPIVLPAPLLTMDVQALKYPADPKYGQDIAIYLDSF